MAREIRPKYARGYNTDFLNWWYNENGLGSVLTSAGFGDVIKKAAADYEWDFPGAFTTYGEPVFAPKVELWLARNSEVYSLLPKSTFIAKGDSFKYIETELDGLVAITATSTPDASLAKESAPTITNVELIRPGYYGDYWKVNWMGRVESGWQKATDPKTDPAYIKAFHAEALPNQIDKLLTLTADTTPAATTVESLDTLLSINTEAGTTYLSAATDNDLWFGKSSAEQIRANDTDDTYGCGAGGADTAMIGAGTNARVVQLDFIDDALAAAKPYSKNKNYIMVMGNKTLNEIQKLIDPKQRFLDTPMNYQKTLNGVSTRKGVVGGFTVSGLISNGLTIPVFTCDHVANETSTNRSSKITDADIGNIYIIDLDAIELRVAVPVTYIETPPSSMLSIDYLQSRHMFLWAAQLLCSNFRSHACVKYLKSS